MLHQTHHNPNILLIVLDAARADHFSCYGYPKTTTPFIDELAQQGARFEYAYTSSRWSLPAHASLFTGASSSKHGVGIDRTGIKRLGDSRWRVLAEYLRGQGYNAAGFSNNTFVSRDFCFHRGFDYFRETWKLVDENDALFSLLQRLGGHGIRTGHRRDLGHRINRFYFNRVDRRWWRGEKGARKTNRMFARWLKYLWLDHQPFFAFIQYLEPHSPYWPPRPFRSMFLDGDERRARELSDKSQRSWVYLTEQVRFTEGDWEVLKALYDGQLCYIDFRLRELVNILKRNQVLDNTVIIVTADHGECFGEHGWIGHISPSLYEPGIRIPLVIRYPHLYRAGEVVSAPVSILDIYSTIADMLGDQDYLFSQLQGHSLLPNRFSDLEDRIVVIEALEAHADAFAKYGPDFDSSKYDYFQHALRWRDYKYIQKSREGRELYNLIKDPDEQLNLVSQQPQFADKLQQRLDEWLASFEPCPPARDESDWDVGEEVKERLAALGYI